MTFIYKIMSRIRFIVAATVVLLVTLLGYSYLLQDRASAANIANFDPSRIIDDAVFYNTSAISVDGIQNFLNSKVPTCNNNHAGFTGSTGTVYNPQFICLKDFYENPDASYTIGFNYLDRNGATQVDYRTYYRNNAYQYNSLCPVYVGGSNTCGSGDYTQGIKHLMADIQPMNSERPPGSISAAQIIYNAAQTYGLNPQALIVLLQKEQSLVTDTWPAVGQYQSATGYGCPDYVPCSSGYAGFSKQLYNAAWQFKQYRLSPGSYSYVANRNNNIQWSPIASCGSSTVYLQNQATAGLYNYTPYRPNQAALSAGYGTGDSCSAYGNRNFWLYFTDWFGSTWQVPASDATVAGGLYRLTVPGGKSLDVAGAGTSDGTDVQIWAGNTSGAQYWQITYLNNGFYSLKNYSSGKYLDVAGGGKSNGTDVRIWSGNGSCAQQWAIMANSGGYALVSACSGLALDVWASAVNTDGANVQIYTRNPADGQKWQLTRLDVADGLYRLTVPGGKSLDVAGAQTTDGTGIQIWGQNTTGAQYWQVTSLGNGFYSLRILCQISILM